MRIAFVLAIGLLPIWFVVAFSVWLAKGSTANAIFAGHWLLIPAVPACAVAALIAYATVRVHDQTTGTSQRKLARAAGFFGLAAAILLLLGLVAWGVSVSRSEDVAREKELALEFLKEQPEVRAALARGEKLDLVLSTTIAAQSTRFNYEFGIYGKQTVYAIVEADRAVNPPRLRILCYTPLYFGHRDPHKPACTQ